MNASNEEKYRIQRSYVYIGYKFLWIVQMFLEGKRFPYGELTEQQWRYHVYDILNFVSAEEYLTELLDFDPDMFFRVIAKLFRQKPWQFITEMNQTKIDALVDSNDILALFETRGHKYEQLKGNPRVLESFYSFVLRVFVTQKEDQQKKPAVGFGVKAPEALPIDY